MDVEGLGVSSSAFFPVASSNAGRLLQKPYDTKKRLLFFAQSIEAPRADNAAKSIEAAPAHIGCGHIIHMTCNAYQDSGRYDRLQVER